MAADIRLITTVSSLTEQSARVNMSAVMFYAFVSSTDMKTKPKKPARKRETIKTAAAKVAAMFGPVTMTVRLAKQHDVSKDELVMMVTSYWDSVQ